MRVFRLIWASTTFRMGKRNVSARKEAFFQKRQPNSMGKSVRCGYYCLLFLNERNKGTSFANILKMFTNDVLQNERIVKNYFHKIYTMEVYCVKEKRHTPNVKGSEKVVIAKNNRKPLSNIDLKKWCNFLRIPIKGIFSRNQPKPLFHSACIINLDDFGNLGTHWVCCWRSKNGMLVHGKKHFFRNDNQIQWEKSVRCGYYCLLVLNERNKGTSFANILKMFTDDVLQNERIVKNYFS